MIGKMEDTPSPCAGTGTVGERPTFCKTNGLGRQVTVCGCGRKGGFGGLGFSGTRVAVV